MSNENENVQVAEADEGQVINFEQVGEIDPPVAEETGDKKLSGESDDSGGEIPHLDTRDESGQIAQSDEDQAGSRHPDDDDSNPGHDDLGSDEQDTFDRSYVEKLRKENAKYRDRAKHADDLAHRLHTALVAADGRLADPADLPYDESHLDDPEALTAAVTALVKSKPGLRAQQIRGDVGAGDRGTPKKAPVDLIGIMRGM
jgi:hypothetical protein